MVKTRMARFGAKKSPYYHIVAADHERCRDGKFLEQIGTYDPRKPYSAATIDTERLSYWVGKGAQISTSLKKVIRERAKSAPAS